MKILVSVNTVTVSWMYVTDVCDNVNNSALSSKDDCLLTMIRVSEVAIRRTSNVTLTI